MAVGYLASLLLPPATTSARELTLWGWLEERRKALQEPVPASAQSPDAGP